MCEERAAVDLADAHMQQQSQHQKWNVALCCSSCTDCLEANDLCATSGGCVWSLCWHVMDKQTYLSFDCGLGCKVMQQLPLSLKPAESYLCVVRLCHVHFTNASVLYHSNGQLNMLLH
jgi:hypothetical protein